MPDADALPPEALAADPDGEPEDTANASLDADGPEGHIEDADQAEVPDGSVTADRDAARRTRRGGGRGGGREVPPDDGEGGGDGGGGGGRG